MQSQSHHSKLAGMISSRQISQKPFNYSQYNGIKQNSFQKAYSPSTNIVNSVNINTRLK